MIIYYGGAEQRTWMNFMYESGVRTVSMSWYGLKRRNQGWRNYRIANEFPEDMKVFLDSGAYSVNKNAEVTQDEAYELAQDYMDFVDANIDSIAFASEFDAMALGRDLIWDLRRQYWSHLDPQRWMAVWHSEWGSHELRAMAGAYERVGILQSDGANQDVSALLRTLASGTAFHGVAMTKMDLMRELPLQSVGSTSWLSPTQFGDTFVWDGQELNRYPRAYKHRRMEHRRLFEANGFDPDKIEADDNHELLRLSLWSWEHFAASIQNRAVTRRALDPFNENRQDSPAAVDTPAPRTRNTELVRRETRAPLPFFRTEELTVQQPDGSEHSQQIMKSPSETFLQCDTCYIRDRCPAMQPGAECYYEIPVQIRTSPQVTALQDTLIEIQTQRVLRMNMIEQVEGGHADQKTSEEMDRLQKMISAKINNAKERTPLIAMSVGTPSQSGGFLSSMFGTATAERINELPAPVDSAGVVEAEIVE